MAQGLSNAGIGRRLWVTEGTVEKHVRSILTKLNLPEAEDDHRRVRAVIVYLESRRTAGWPSTRRRIASGVSGSVVGCRCSGLTHDE
jgi:hypothetical protein